jgi:hypothetical protein
MLKKLLLTTLLTFSLGLCRQADAQFTGNNVCKTALTKLANQVKSFPQEKIYIQFDKPYYSAGERLWFRIHIVHAALHSPASLSRYVYVELLNSANDVVIRKKIRPLDKMFFGQIDLSPELPKGWYSIRAYTNYMRNIDEDWFFRRNIYIGNSLQENPDSEAKSSEIKSKPETKNPKMFDIQFFPEGGHLVAGNIQIIGFSSVTKDGSPVDISGRIVDENNNEACTFKSTGNGVGATSILPVAGKKYKAICEDNQGKSITVQLPLVSEKDIAISVQQNANIVMVSLLMPNAVPLSDTLYIIGQQRCIPIFQNVITPENPFVTISKAKMYSGVTEFILLNKKGEILSNRLVFISGNDKAELTFQPDKTNYGKREAVRAHVTLKDSKGTPLKGNFSVSVTDDSDVKINPDDQTIESYLLLQSDIKEPLEKPGFYFKADNTHATYDLDLLMLTKKWERYDIQNVLAGNYARGDTFALELGSTLTGKVRAFPSKKGIPDVNVSMFVQRGLHADVAKTDKNGKFYFEGFEFPDSTTIRLQADKGKMFVDLIPDQDTFPEVKILAKTNTEVIPDKDLKKYLEKSRNKYFYDNGMMTINLDKVEIVGKKEDKYVDIRKNHGSAVMNPSNTIDEDKFMTASSILEVLLMTPGIMPDDTGTGVLIRNKKPLIVVDNIEYSIEDMNMISPTEVKMIDILKDPTETAMFGSAGQNGVIYIYLKRGEEIIPTNELKTWQAKITPLGYSIPAEFNGPKYQSEEERLSSIPDLRTTIFWKPNVQCNENGEADFNFYTADAAGTYTVTIEGVTPAGEIIHYTGKLNRK